MKALILAGGAGTRLRPLTYRIPKSVIPVVNKPLIVHQIELLKKAGITEIILSLYYLADEIKKVLAGGEKLGVKLFYSVEEKPLGTAGAAKNAAAYFDEEPLVILNGDVLAQIDLGEVINFYHKNLARLVIVLTPVGDPSPYGLVITDSENRVEKFLEKPSRNQITQNTINAGIYVLDPRLFDFWTGSPEFSFERELFPLLLNKKVPFFAYVNHDYWNDLGSPKKYLETHFDIMKEKLLLTPAGQLAAPGVWLGQGVKIEDKNYRIKGPAVIGNNCQIRKGSQIEELVTLGHEVVVGENSLIERSVIMDRVIIGKNSVILDSIIGSSSVIEDEVIIENGQVLACGSVVKQGSKIQGGLK